MDWASYFVEHEAVALFLCEPVVYVSNVAGGGHWCIYVLEHVRLSRRSCRKGLVHMYVLLVQCHHFHFNLHYS